MGFGLPIDFRNVAALDKTRIEHRFEPLFNKVSSYPRDRGGADFLGLGNGLVTQFRLPKSRIRIEQDACMRQFLGGVLPNGNQFVKVVTFFFGQCDVI